jgi:hypothetical protein
MPLSFAKLEHVLIGSGQVSDSQTSTGLLASLIGMNLKIENKPLIAL